MVYGRYHVTRERGGYDLVGELKRPKERTSNAYEKFKARGSSRPVRRYGEYVTYMSFS